MRDGSRDGRWKYPRTLKQKRNLKAKHKTQTEKGKMRRQDLLARKRIETKTRGNVRSKGGGAWHGNDVPRAKKVSDRGASAHKGTIVVPIDFTEASFQGLDYALAMAKGSNSPMALVHVVQAGYGGALVDAKLQKRIRAKALRDARARLDALANSSREPDMQIRCIVASGSAEYEILRIAEEINAGMIVLGRQDRSALSRLIFGSVTAEILDAAKCPVLVINQGKEVNN
jgi:nucleotide-binding universal stress UspA family protein